MSGGIDEAARLLADRFGERVRRDVPLAPFTSFRIGGPASLYVEPDDDGDLAAISDAVQRTSVAWMVIGKGSNVLVADEGFPGLVVRMGRGFRTAHPDGDRLRAGASMPLPALAGVALANALSGLEFGVAIPASLGGAVWMNAGAHGHSMHEVLETIDLFSVAEGQRRSVRAADAGFAYRTSAFPADSIVVGATVSLTRADRAHIREEMEAARRWRRETQPLAEPNCGSVFKNPPRDHAARLVEAAGAKGLRVGGAEVSRKHANFIVTRPGATAADVLRLMREVQERVAERYGVRLEPEVRYVGGELDVASI